MKSTPKRWLKEYRAGRDSALATNHSEKDNLRKMKSALEDKTTPDLVRAYWKGYEAGLKLRK